MPIPVQPPRDARDKTPVFFPAACTAEARQECIVEIGPGRGDFLFHLATTHPTTPVIGIEIKSKRMDKLIERAQKRSLGNVMLIQADGREALPRFFDEQSILQLHIHFPDPWPKTTHRKHRLISPDFVNECAQRLKPKGMLSFTTDSLAYAQQTRKIFSEEPLLESCFADGIALHSDEAFPTFFSKKWMALGRTIYYQKYRKK